MENTHWEDGEESPWAKTHKKGEFEGMRIPFGARVLFKPSETRPGDVPGKWEPDALEGILAGYDMAPGYTWTRRYLVWSLTDFDNMTLRKNIVAEEFPVREPFSVARIVVPAGAWVFPLKDRYDRLNFAIEGDADRAEIDNPQLRVAPPNAEAAQQEEHQAGEVPNYAVDNIPRRLRRRGRPWGRHPRQ